MSEIIGSLDSLVAQLEAYVPFNEQEEKDRKIILEAIREYRYDLFLRSSQFAHMTASAWVMTPDVRKVLMVYHNIYQSWSWLGGHADGETDLLKVAVKEVKEESGLTTVLPVSENIYSLEVLTVDGHEKKGVYVSSHLHLNITYLLIADSTDSLRMKKDENSGVQWFDKEQAPNASSETWFRERIYTKLNQKLEEHTTRTFLESLDSSIFSGIRK